MIPYCLINECSVLDCKKFLKEMSLNHNIKQDLLDNVYYKENQNTGFVENDQSQFNLLAEKILQKPKNSNLENIIEKIDQNEIDLNHYQIYANCKQIYNSSQYGCLNNGQFIKETNFCDMFIKQRTLEFFICDTCNIDSCKIIKNFPNKNFVDISQNQIIINRKTFLENLLQNNTIEELLSNYSTNIQLQQKYFFCKDENNYFIDCTSSNLQCLQDYQSNSTFEICLQNGKIVNYLDFCQNQETMIVNSDITLNKQECCLYACQSMISTQYTCQNIYNLQKEDYCQTICKVEDSLTNYNFNQYNCCDDLKQQCDLITGNLISKSLICLQNKKQFFPLNELQNQKTKCWNYSCMYYDIPNTNHFCMINKISQTYTYQYIDDCNQVDFDLYSLKKIENCQNNLCRQIDCNILKCLDENENFNHTCNINLKEIKTSTDYCFYKTKNEILQINDSDITLEQCQQEKLKNCNSIFQNQFCQKNQGTIFQKNEFCEKFSQTNIKLKNYVFFNSNTEISNYCNQLKCLEKLKEFQTICCLHQEKKTLLISKKDFCKHHYKSDENIYTQIAMCKNCSFQDCCIIKCQKENFIDNQNLNICIQETNKSVTSEQYCQQKCQQKIQQPPKLCFNTSNIQINCLDQICQTNICKEKILISDLKCRKPIEQFSTLNLPQYQSDYCQNLNQQNSIENFDYEKDYKENMFCQDCKNKQECCQNYYINEFNYSTCLLKNGKIFDYLNSQQTSELYCSQDQLKISQIYFCHNILNEQINCSQQFCQSQQCLLNQIEDKTFCRITGTQNYDQYSFYQNKQEFCLNEQINYQEFLNNEQICQHSCDKKTCCYLQCMEVPYLSKCRKKQILTKEVFCFYKCIKEDNKIENCYNDDGDIIECKTCDDICFYNLNKNILQYKKKNFFCISNYKNQNRQQSCSNLDLSKSLKIYCNDKECDHYNCCLQQCLDEYPDDIQETCNLNFFTNKQQLCESFCYSKQKPYKIGKKYADKNDCCLISCQNQYTNVEKKRCIYQVNDQYVQLLSNVQEICEIECKNFKQKSKILLKTCRDSNDQIIDCQLNDCQNTNCLARLKIITQNKIFWGTQNTLYDGTLNSQIKFCQEQQINIHLQVQMCGDFACSTTKEICIKNCDKNKINIQPTCDVQYNCIEKDICQKKCSGISFIQPQTINADSLIQNQQECIKQICLEKMNQHKICYKENLNPIEKNEFCEIFSKKFLLQNTCLITKFDLIWFQQQINELIFQKRILKCYNDEGIQINCINDHCKNFDCLIELQIENNISKKVCYIQNENYQLTDTLTYCKNNNIDNIYLLQNSIFDKYQISEKQCCLEVCNYSFIKKYFEPVCSEDFNEYHNIFDYCFDSCNKNIKILQCEGKNCSLDQCKLKNCEQLGGFDKCNQETFQIITISQFCEENLQQTQNCFNSDGNQRNCLVSDCQILKCLKILKNYQQNICLKNKLNNQYYFSNIQEYCQEYILQDMILSDDMEIDLQECKQNNKIIECNKIDCYLQNCQNLFDNFQGVICGSDQVLYYSSQQFCLAQQIDKDIKIDFCYGDKNPEICQQTCKFCSLTQCFPQQQLKLCYQQTQQSTNQKFCSIDGNFFNDQNMFCSYVSNNNLDNQQQICNFECQKINDIYLCEYNEQKTICSQQECQIIKCIYEVQNLNLKFPICIQEGYDELYYFANVKNYCFEKIKNNDFDFITILNTKIYQRQSPQQCFKQVYQNNFKIGWLNSKRMNLDGYTKYLTKKKIKNNREIKYFINEVNFCQNNDQNIDCENPCEKIEICLKHCKKYLKKYKYPFKTICIKQEDNKIIFWNDINKFCQDIVQEYDFYFELIKYNFKCGISGVEKCNSIYDCYFRDCISNPQSYNIIENSQQEQIQKECENLFKEKKQFNLQIIKNICRQNKQIKQILKEIG